MLTRLVNRKNIRILIEVSGWGEMVKEIRKVVREILWRAYAVRRILNTEPLDVPKDRDVVVMRMG